MKTNVVAGALMAAALFTGGCRSYQGVSRDPETKEVYIAGYTAFLIFGGPWVAKCTEIKSDLFCDELDVQMGRFANKQRPVQKRAKREQPEPEASGNTLD